MNDSRFRDIPSPARTDGVGTALRHAFAPMGSDEDFSALIEQLNHRTPR